MLRFDPHVFLLSAGKPAKKNGIVVLARSPFWKYVSEWLFAGERLPGRILPGGGHGFTDGPLKMFAVSHFGLERGRVKKSNFSKVQKPMEKY